MNKFQKGFTLVETLLLTLILVLIGFGGYYIWHQNAKTATSSSTTTKSSTTANPYSGWKTYCSTYEKACFKYPSSWTLTDHCSGGSCPGLDNITLDSPNKSMINFTSSIAGRGGMCQPDTPDSFITSVTAMPSVKGLYLVQFSRADITQTDFGVDDTINGSVPKTGDTGTCAMYTQFTAKNTPNAGVDLSGVVPDSAKNTDLNTALMIVKSYYYQ